MLTNAKIAGDMLVAIDFALALWSSKTMRMNAASHMLVAMEMNTSPVLI